MSTIIIGGNECMGRTYRDLCAKYNITPVYFLSDKASAQNPSPQVIIIAIQPWPSFCIRNRNMASPRRGCIGG